MTLKQARQCCKLDENYRIRYKFFYAENNTHFEWSLERKPEMSLKWQHITGNGMIFGIGIWNEDVWPKGRN